MVLCMSKSFLQLDDEQLEAGIRLPQKGGPSGVIVFTLVSPTVQ